jgi:hypothetical protein
VCWLTPLPQILREERLFAREDLDCCKAHAATGM